MPGRQSRSTGSYPLTDLSVNRIEPLTRFGVAASCHSAHSISISKGSCCGGGLDESTPFLTRRRRRRRRGPRGWGRRPHPPSLASSPLPVQRMALLFQLSLLFSGLTEVKEPGARPGQGGAPDLHLLQPRGSCGVLSPSPRGCLLGTAVHEVWDAFLPSGPQIRLLLPANHSLANARDLTGLPVFFPRNDVPRL